MRWAAALILGLSAVGCSESGSAPEAGGEGEAEAGAGLSQASADSTAARVGAFLLRYVEATAEGDEDALRAMFAADDRFVWIEDGAVRYRSPDDVLQGLSAFPPESPVRTVLGEVDVAVLAGGAVHAWTPFSTTVGEEGNAFTFHGMLSFSLEPDGDSWRIVGGHTSTERERPAP